MKKVVQSFWPIFLLLVICLVFFYPVLLKDLVLLPADFVVGVYYPWLDYKWGGYGAGVPVKNPITTDVVSFMYPMQIFALEQLKQGVIPLWNNLILTGTPLLANFQSAPFSPTNFLYFIFPVLDAWNIQVMLQPILAAMFLYLLLRFIDLSKIASLAGGLFYGFAGFITIWMQWNGHGLTAAFFPLMILLFLKYIQKPATHNGVFISVILALQVFSGYPQIILYQFMALGLLIVIYDHKFLLNFKKTFMLAFFIFLGLALTAIQVLPGYELLTLSQRSVELVLNEWAFLPWHLIITLIAPDYFGSHATRNYWGPADYTLTTGFVGASVIVLAGIGLLSNLKDKGVRFGASLIVLSLFIAFPNPITVFIKESGFLGLQAASAHRILILSNLGFAILAAFGINYLLSKELNWKVLIRAYYLPFTLLMTYVIISTFIFVTLKDSNSELYINIQTGLRNLALPALFFITAVALTILIKVFKKAKFFLVALLIFFTVLELFRFGWKFTPFSPKEFVFPKTPVISFLQNQQTPFRVSAEDVIPINFLMAYGIETIEGYDAVYPLLFANYLSALNSGSVGNTPMGRYGSVSSYNSSLLDIANVKYILALKRDQSGKPDVNGEITDKFSSDRYMKVYEDKSVAILENKDVLPRSFVSYKWKSSQNDDEVINDLINGYTTNGIILDSDPGIPTKELPFSETKYSQSFSNKKIKVNALEDGVLFVADAYFPGWKAYVDGREEKILRANYAFMAVPIKKGTQEVAIKYLPESFENGKLISGMSTLTLLGLLVFNFLKKGNINARS